MSFSGLQIASLSNEELQDEYRRIEKVCQELQKLVDSGKQKIYELERNLSASTATQDYLSAELDALQTSRDVEIDGVQRKCGFEVEKMKEEIGKLRGDRTNLEKQIEELTKSMDEQRQEFMQKLTEREPEKSFNISRNDTILEMQCTELNEKLEDTEAQLQQMKVSQQEVVQERELQREKIECLESRCQGYVEEIAEKSQLIEELQEKVFEVNTEMMALKNDPSAMNRKGNSLFGEVDDQRQKMKNILAAQTKKYNEMKAAYREGQTEIRRLKQENSDIADEFRYIKNMFISADGAYRKELMGQIGALRVENGGLREKIAWTEEKLNQMAKEHGVHWTDEMMRYFNSQVSKIEENLKCVLHQKIQLDENVHRMQQDLAKWRYKCLKYKCALINRELLLEEQNISFPDVQNVPIDPSVEVDINNFEDTFERDINPPTKPPPAILNESSFMKIPEDSKENIPDNKITFRDIKFPQGVNEKKSNCPVGVYLDSNAETTSTDNPPSSGTTKQHPDKPREKNNYFTIKKIVFRK